jgi:hypothetical protein
MLFKESFGIRSKPPRVAQFDGDINPMAKARQSLVQRIEIELQRGRELQQDRSKLAAESVCMIH